MSAVVSRRSLLGWLAALPLASNAVEAVERIAEKVVVQTEQVVVQAAVDFGDWTNYAAYHLARAYDIQWKLGPPVNIPTRST